MTDRKIKFASDALSGGAITVAASQGGKASVPASLTQSNWGSGVGGGGGTVTIVPDRTSLQCAPDTVRFSVDMSQATFDPQPGTGGFLGPAQDKCP